MNKLLFAIGAAGAIAAAAPTVAQTSANARGAVSLSSRIAQLDTRLQTGVSAGTIDRTEARTLRTDIAALNRLERQYSRNGLTDAEREDLTDRIRDIRQDLRTADRGQNGRYAAWDREWDAEAGTYTGVGGPVEAGVACEVRTGVGGLLAGVINRATGTVDTDCGLNVGQRVPGNLVSVPATYRTQYRDGNGVYYRADGQNVYQIDNRTHQVTQVFPMTR